MELKDLVKGAYGMMYVVRDMKKSVEFYKDLYGKGPTYESPEWTTFDLGGVSLCLHNTDKPEEIDGKAVLIHNTQNLKAMVPVLRAAGVEIERDYHQICEGGYGVDVRDPSGNRLSLFEYVGQ